MADVAFDTFEENDWQHQAEEDERAITELLNRAPGEDDNDPKLNLDRPLDLGEKDDDAVDYEDISDDDLPEEEEATLPQVKQEQADDDDLFGDGNRGTSPYDDDDLFGDGRATSPFEGAFGQNGQQTNGVTGVDALHDVPLASVEPEPEDLAALNFPVDDYDPDNDLGIPDDPDELIKVVKAAFPAFEEHGVLDWYKLLPPHAAIYIPPQPAKPPKPLNPTKVSLEIAVDQEKLFRGTTTAEKRKFDAYNGIIYMEEQSADGVESDDEFDYTPIDPNDKVGGFSLQDIEMVCADFESAINQASIEPDVVEILDPLDEWEREVLGEDYVKPKKATINDDFVMKPHYPVPDFDNFEAMTHQVAKRPLLDLNDPYLLVEFSEYNQAAKRPKLRHGRTGVGGITSALTSRFNYSNDEAYEALKENHQSKVRATLGNLSIEHSLPAQKLQWPYYLTSLNPKDARRLHRPSLKFTKFQNMPIYFSKAGIRKKKSVKGLQVKDIFKETKDLSLADHYSSASLFEYSEENPTVLSNFGMGNRVVNYYRRKHADDAERPQPEDKIGDLTVLLPEDKSPFSNFGMVDPGETVRTLHNGMYRAPIFKHDPKNTDFLCIRSSTGIGGTNWHIRNIDSVFVVGQTLPSTEIPGPHSRRVTNAAKNRMKMIAYRKIRHDPHHHVKIADITAHIAGSTDMQNRQKLKEFMTYDKVEKVWKMPANESVKEEAQIRSMVKPEDVCVIDAMQVGVQQLTDAGFAPEDKEDDDEDGNEAQNLAPWRTTKSFLEASADKAMLALKGPGDPSGRGLALSFLKTSMKGGFLENIAKTGARREEVKAALDREANGGHGYNVKRQQEIYKQTIREIWERQKTNLNDPTEHDTDPLYSDLYRDKEKYGEFDTPEEISQFGTPAHNDDTASQYSTKTNKVLQITRVYKNKFGQKETVTETITDPKVLQAYDRHKVIQDIRNTDVYKIVLTGDPELDRLRMEYVQTELERLNNNKDRRKVREKQKQKLNARQSPSSSTALSPSSTPAPSIEKSTGTTRKCANCGMMGHIKTNKKYCPNCKHSANRPEVRARQAAAVAVTDA